MGEKQVIFEDLGRMDYRLAWDYQENLLQKNIDIKSEISKRAFEYAQNLDISAGIQQFGQHLLQTTNHLLFVEHTPVYTLGKSGHIENLLIGEDEMRDKGIEFFKTNRGGDITFHGPGQLVGYPILDLEKFGTDIGKYMRNLEEVIIRTLDAFCIKGYRSTGETGVWIEPGIQGKERKIAAMGVRCSRWITMHGFALNVNTDLAYFKNIVACGIQDKLVTSMEKELGQQIAMESVKAKLKENFSNVFDVDLVERERFVGNG